MIKLIKESKKNDTLKVEQDAVYLNQFCKCIKKIFPHHEQANLDFNTRRN
jgi:hypothetical protein